MIVSGRVSCTSGNDCEVLFTLIRCRSLFESYFQLRSGLAEHFLYCNYRVCSCNHCIDCMYPGGWEKAWCTSSRHGQELQVVMCLTDGRWWRCLVVQQLVKTWLIQRTCDPHPYWRKLLTTYWAGMYCSIQHQFHSYVVHDMINVRYQ